MAEAADPLDYYPFRRPNHYNAKGHRVVADTVLRALNLDLAGTRP